jgi:hypothetical protein
MSNVTDAKPTGTAPAAGGDLKAPKSEQASFREIMNKSAASAMRGGTAGAIAMGANVACLMWMRTTVSGLFIVLSSSLSVFLSLFLSNIHILISFYIPYDCCHVVSSTRWILSYTLYTLYAIYTLYTLSTLYYII